MKITTFIYKEVWVNLGDRLNWMFLLLVLIVLVAIFLVITIAKKLFKIALVIGAIFLILFFITGGSIISDFSNIKDKVGSSNLVLLADEGILTGFVQEDGYKGLSDAEIARLDGLYMDNKLEEMKQDYYKLYIFKMSTLKEAEINNKEVNKEEMKDFFIQGEGITQITIEDILLTVNISNHNMESALFAYLYDDELKMTSSPIEFFKSYKEGELMVYPETMFFRFTKIIPLSWIDEKLNNLKNSVKDTAKDAGEKAKEAIV